MYVLCVTIVFIFVFVVQSNLTVTTFLKDTVTKVQMIKNFIHHCVILDHIK